MNHIYKNKCRYLSNFIMVTDMKYKQTKYEHVLLLNKTSFLIMNLYQLCFYKKNQFKWTLHQLIHLLLSLILTLMKDSLE